MDNKLNNAQREMFSIWQSRVTSIIGEKVTLLELENL
ncbi:hypothetical protein JOC37_001819 [Desulfohalotomaculum tongense]|nr:hypothetical protein [Desulforadius tongensis]